MHVINRFTWKSSQNYATVLNIGATVLTPSMRVLFTSPTYPYAHVSSIIVLAPFKRMLFCCRHIFIFVFFHVLVCSLLLRCMLGSPALRVGVKTLYDTITYVHLYNTI